MVRFTKENGPTGLKKARESGEEFLETLISDLGSNLKLMVSEYTNGKTETDTKVNGLTV
jgi:hypothetical protein